MAAVLRRKIDIQHYIVNLDMKFQWKEFRHTVHETEIRSIHPQEVKSPEAPGFFVFLFVLVFNKSYHITESQTEQSIDSVY